MTEACSHSSVRSSDAVAQIGLPVCSSVFDSIVNSIGSVAPAGAGVANVHDGCIAFALFLGFSPDFCEVFC